MQLALIRMSNPMHRMLSQKDMFPSKSRLHEIVRSCRGDGYKALKAILMKLHLIFYDQPSTLIRVYPSQGDLTMRQYHELFLDFLQLRAFIMNIDKDLDSSDELDIFIANAKYSDYLNRVTRDD